jgi:hypothetical protein
MTIRLYLDEDTSDTNLIVPECLELTFRFQLSAFRFPLLSLAHVTMQRCNAVTAPRSVSAYVWQGCA